MDQSDIDRAIERYYTSGFDEGARLTTRSAQGRLEFERTQSIVRRCTPAPARILDVGGATGVHAAALAADGYEVVLVDPVESQVRAAQGHGTFTATVGDARALDFADDTFDAVLMAGPLYHLSSREDRVQALGEGLRVCRVGGFVHAAAIPRFLAFAVAYLDREPLEESPQDWLDLLRRGVPPTTTAFPAAHFHTPVELADEMIAAGLTNVSVVGLEGPTALALEITAPVEPEVYDAAGTVAVAFEHSPIISNFSCHLLGSGRVG